MVYELLEVLARENVRGTFFILGWLAEREPAMVQAIAHAGHEVASHGWGHRRVGEVSRDEFRDSIRRTKALLESLTGIRVEGYRAPSFSIVPGVEWALDVLIEEGHAYDSSMYPLRVHPRYGYPQAHQDPHVIQRSGGNIVEVPLATAEVFGRTLPAAGGAYGRFLPFSLINRGLRSAQERSSSGTVYVHPWELDVQTRPPFFLPLVPRIRMSFGRRRTWRWIQQVITRYDFRPIAETVRHLTDPVTVEALPSRQVTPSSQALRPSA